MTHSKQEPIVRTKEEQAQTLANYLPSGRAFGAKNLSTSNIRNLLRGFSNELIIVDNFIKLFRTDIVPGQTQFFLEEWERVVGIPDHCFDGKGTILERRTAVVLKLAALGIQTNSDFVRLAETFGLSVTVTSGSVTSTIFPWIFPVKFYATDKAARFTIVVTPIETIGETFTYTFPIPFGTENLVILKCLFNEFRPANVEVVFQN